MKSNNCRKHFDNLTKILRRNYTNIFFFLKDSLFLTCSGMLFQILTPLYRKHFLPYSVFGRGRKRDEFEPRKL